MEHLRRLMLLDEHGKPLSIRVDGVLAGLLQKFRKRFPSIQDEGDLTEIFEEAARRIDKRERQSGPIEKVHSYAWVTLRSVGLSWLRRGSSRLALQTVQSQAGQSILSTLAAKEGSPERIEQDILLHELLTQLTPDESAVFMLKKAGYSSDEIPATAAARLGAIDVLFMRVKRKIRRLAGVPE